MNRIGRRAARRVQPLQQGPERLLPLPGRRQRERREAVRGRQRQQRRPQRHGLRPGQVVLLQVAEQAVEPGLRRLVGGRKPRARSKKSMAGYSPVFWKCGEQRHSMTGESDLPFDHLPQDMLLQRVDQARLAQARLADEQDDLAHALLGLLPAVLEQADLVVAAGQRRESCGCRRLDQARRPRRLPPPGRARPAAPRP